MSTYYRTHPLDIVLNELVDGALTPLQTRRVQGHIAACGLCRRKMWRLREVAGTVCPDCGAPFELRRKFNGGNPISFMSPTCECEEKETEAQVDQMIARMGKDRHG